MDHEQAKRLARELGETVAPCRSDLVEGFQERLALVVRRGQLTRALQRVVDGSYGTCDGCGQPIETARLIAIPDATTCGACQTKREHADTRAPSTGLATRGVPDPLREEAEAEAVS